MVPGARRRDRVLAPKLISSRTPKTARYERNFAVAPTIDKTAAFENYLSFVVGERSSPSQGLAGFFHSGDFRHCRIGTKSSADVSTEPD